MSRNTRTIGFKQLMLAAAILVVPGFMGIAIGQPQGPPNVDANGDGAVTFEEASVLRCMDRDFFNRLDADGNGVLSQEELPARPRFGRRGMGPQGFANLDADGDGAVTFDEASVLRFMDEERFKTLDANGDGVLSQDELPQRPRFGRRGMGRRGFGRLDTNGDGTVTREEASAPRMDEERFKTLDANGDGVLSQDELPQRPHFGRHGMGRRGFGGPGANDNGAVTFDKSSMPCMDEEYFKRLDINGDGVLSQEELPSGCRLAPGYCWR